MRHTKAEIEALARRIHTEARANFGIGCVPWETTIERFRIQWRWFARWHLAELDKAKSPGLARKAHRAL